MSLGVRRYLTPGHASETSDSCRTPGGVRELVTLSARGSEAHEHRH